MSKYIYLLNVDTEFFSSETRVLGCYLTLTEAVVRVEQIRNITPVQCGVFGSFWKNETSGLRYYLRKFALGSQQKKGTTFRGQVVNLETEDQQALTPLTRSALYASSEGGGQKKH